MMMKKTSSYSAGRFTVGYILLSLAFALATLLLWAIALYGVGTLPTQTTDADSDGYVQEEVCIVIDAGHGGEDGGAVGVDGLAEKTVNLQIARMLHEQLTVAGIPSVMTRSDDRLLYDPNADYHGRKKMLDLRARLDILEQTPDSVFVSIHLNAFPEPQYSGLQVYYSPNHTDSIRLAERIQRLTQNQLQPENKRKIKAADSGIYLLNRSMRPAVLVECGFLSNPEECAKLRDQSYIGELSTLLFGAICDYLSEGGDGT